MARTGRAGKIASLAMGFFVAALLVVWTTETPTRVALPSEERETLARRESPEPGDGALLKSLPNPVLASSTTASTEPGITLLGTLPGREDAVAFLRLEGPGTHVNACAGEEIRGESGVVGVLAGWRRVAASREWAEFSVGG